MIRRFFFKPHAPGLYARGRAVCGACFPAVRRTNAGSHQTMRGRMLGIEARSGNVTYIGLKRIIFALGDDLRCSLHPSPWFIVRCNSAVSDSTTRQRDSVLISTSKRSEHHRPDLPVRGTKIFIRWLGVLWAVEQDALGGYPIVCWHLANCNPRCAGFNPEDPDIK